jgi:hypothetical protein
MDSMQAKRGLAAIFAVIQGTTQHAGPIGGRRRLDGSTSPVGSHLVKEAPLLGARRSARVGFGRLASQGARSRHRVLVDLGANQLEGRTLLSLAGASQDQILQTYGQIPLSFEVNRGQTAAEVDFLSQGNGYSLFLTPTETVLSLQKPAPAAGDGTATPDAAVLRSRFVGANPQPQVVGVDQLASTSNYFTGNDPSQWQTNIANYGRVEYQNLYPGVDLVFYGNQQELEYDYVVAPGANPGVIKLAIDGAESITLDDQGNLVLHTSGGDVVEQAPVVYQESGGVRQPVSGQFVLESGGQVGFALGIYDHSQPLVIDPVLSYSTYLGGKGEDEGYGIAVDAAGNAYVTGRTGSANFPATASAVQTSLPGIQNAFVMKLNPTGTALVYSTYLGGSGYDIGTAIAVDAAGNAYVTGTTGSSNFPSTTGALQTTYGSNDDVFVTKLNPTGTALVYSTYLGGTSDDDGEGIAVDAAGNAYVTGYTDSSKFPTTPGAYQTALGGSVDAFVTKLNPTGTALVYSTYLGGTGGDSAFGIAVDNAGDAYVTGKTQNVTGNTDSTDFPTTPGAYQTAFRTGLSGDDFDAFVTKLNPAGTALVYSTYLGGTSDDTGRGIAVDAAGNAYVTGNTDSTDFPTTPGAYQAPVGGDSHAFVTKLNPAGTALVYSTYLGGTGYGIGTAIAVDAAGDLYVTGWTQSANFPITPGALQTTYGGGNYDAFVTKFAFETQTTTALTTSASPSTYGDWVTFTAALTAQGSPVTSGTVDFKEGDTVLASTVPLSASGTAIFSISSLSAITHTITASYSGASGLGASSGSVQQVVNKKAASVTANAATKVYGSADPVLTGSTSGFLAADGVTASFSRTAGETVAGGPYTISATISPAGELSNYAITYHTADFTITARPITVTASSATKVYGAVLPPLTYTIAGFVNGDTASVVSGSPVLSTTATASSHVLSSPYSISISVGTLWATNYSFNVVGGDLSITPAPLTITANNASMEQGAAVPLLSASYSGFVNGDSPASLAVHATVTTPATSRSPAGTYAIVVGSAISPNYSINYANGILVVTPAHVKVLKVSIQPIRLGKTKKTTQVIVVQFSGAMNADDAQSTGSYRLTTIPTNKRQKSKSVALSKAQYNASTNTVTLITRKPLVLNPPIRLTLNAARLLDSHGRSLSGKSVATLSKGRVTF